MASRKMAADRVNVYLSANSDIRRKLEDLEDNDRANVISGVIEATKSKPKMTPNNMRSEFIRMIEQVTNR